MMFNITFNNSSVKSWPIVLLEEETGGSGEYHRHGIISPFKFWTPTIFLHAHLQVVYYNCVQFHKTPISRLGGVALTRGMYLVSATPTKLLIEFL
jgi:hypothetical protein